MLPDIQKMNYWWKKDLHIKKTIPKLSEENVLEYLYDLMERISFKRHINTMTEKNKNFCLLKDKKTGMKI